MYYHIKAPKWLLVFLCLLSSQAWGQFQIPADSSFYTFLDSFYLHYQDDSTEGGIYNHTRRYAMTWGTRLAPTGKMTEANKAMLNYSRVYKSIYPPNTAQGSIIFPSNHPASKDWGELGPVKPVLGNGFGRGMGQIHRIAFHPQYNHTTNQIVYAGSHYGGLFRSDDAGQSWYNYHTDRGLPITSVGGIATSNNHVFICTGNGDHGYARFGQNALYDPLRGNINNYNPIHTQGVYKITHTGNQWVSINGTSVSMLNGQTANDLLEVFGYGGTMRQIIVHPTNENILFIATSQGIFRTQNGGNTWLQVLATIPDGNGNQVLDPEWRGLVFHPTNPNIVYASGQDVYRSVDGGLTWTSMANNQGDFTLPSQIRRINIAVTPASPNYLYAFVVGHYSSSSLGFGHVYLYDGQQWILQNDYNNRLNQCAPDWLGIGVSPVNASHVFVAGLKISASLNVDTNGNATFSSAVGGAIHDDIHAIEYAPDTSNIVVMLGTHGGVSKQDGGSVFTEMYNGLGVSTIWTFDDWEADDNWIVTGNQDVGVQYTSDLGQSWIFRFSGDGYGMRIDEQEGKAFLMLNKAYSINEIDNGFAVLDEVPNIPDMETVLPLDPTTSTGLTTVHNVYPHVNHPKTEESYIGFTELFLRKNYVASDSIINAIMDTNIVIRQLRGSAHVLASNGSIVYRGNEEPCTGNGTFIDTVLVSFNPPLIGFYSARIDTLCEVEQISLTFDTSGIIDNLWQIKSNLKDFQLQGGNRRIMEIGFAEDEQNDHVYLATLGDNSSRRSDFYVNPVGVSCDTCFIRKTNNLPKDSTVLSSIRDPNPITGIAVDPLDGRRVWVSFSGYSRTIKVYYSDDAGDTWTSYDDSNNSLANLNMPINNIVYQRGTKDRLYIATDVGVYVREDQGNWQRYGQNFPNVRTTELKINYCSGKLRAATFGRGVWENDLLPPEASPAYRSFRIISGVETWDKDKHMSRDILIKAGASLILDSMTLNMPKNGLIVIEQGGELQALGSTITNLCGETWSGIEVWGNGQLLQQPTNNQGHVTLIDSRIEYAKNALRNWQVGQIQNTGGILQASNTTFYNNWRSVEMMRYYSGQHEQSLLDGCTFEVDNSYRGFDGDTTGQFLGHVSMWGISNMEIRGCTFKDSRTDKAGDQSQGGSYGILGLNASLKLTSLPQGTGTPTAFVRNSFEGLERGIELAGAPVAGFPIIDQSNFVGTEQAVILRTVDGVRILRDSFFIGDFQSQGSNPTPPAGVVNDFGLGLIGCTAYGIEQNHFTKQGAASTTIGSWIEASGTTPNQLRNNEYQDLSGGNLAHGRNQDLNFQTDGLEYLCNENSNNDHDFVILTNPYTNSGTASIALAQGNNTQASRNSLSDSVTIFPSQSHVYNFSSSQGQLNPPVVYYYTNSLPNNIPDPSLLYNTNRQISAVGPNDYCKDDYTSLLSTNKYNGQPISNFKNQYYQASTSYLQTLEEYDNTPIQDTLERTNLASQVAYWSGQKANWLNEIVAAYLVDTLIEVDSIIYWMEKQEQLEGQYRLVEFHWSQQQYIAALDLLQDLPNRFNFTTQQEEEYDQYVYLKDLLKRAIDQDQTLNNLDYSSVQTLEEIAQLQAGRASLQAKSILRFFYSMEPLDYPYLELEGGARSKVFQEQEQPVFDGAIKAMPNPASKWAQLVYQLPKDVEQAQLLVVNTAGQEIERRVLIKNSTKNQIESLILNISAWAGGTYFVVLSSGGQQIGTTQLVIQR